MRHAVYWLDENFAFVAHSVPSRDTSRMRPKRAVSVARRPETQEIGAEPANSPRSRSTRGAGRTRGARHTGADRTGGRSFGYTGNRRAEH